MLKAMYIEHTPQGYNIMGVSIALLSEIIWALLDTHPVDELPEIRKFIDEAEQELKSTPNS
jgi:hypothetical protein